MENRIKMFFLIILLLLVVGCSYNNDSKNNKTLESKVTIKSYYKEPESLKDKQTIILNGVSEGEFVELVVEGEILDFEHVKLEWDESQSSVKEKETLKSFDRLINQTIVIKTYIPEGIPSEKLKWKSSLGKAYEYIIRENGMGEAGNESGTVFYLE